MEAQLNVEADALTLFLSWVQEENAMLSGRLLAHHHDMTVMQDKVSSGRGRGRGGGAGLVGGCGGRWSGS